MMTKNKVKILGVSLAAVLAVVAASLVVVLAVGIGEEGTVVVPQASGIAEITQEAELAVATASEPEPDHNTVTINCPGAFASCTGRVTINTSDGGTWGERFSLTGGASVPFTFVGLTGGGLALDLANPDVNCFAAGQADTTTIPMGSGATVTGGPISPSTFTVPAGIAATFNLSC